MLYSRIGTDALRARLEHYVSDRFRLDGRVALVTGGGTGIGRGSALVLAEHGADVVLAGRRPEPLEATAKEIGGVGPAAALRCQPTSPMPKAVDSPGRGNPARVREEWTFS